MSRAATYPCQHGETIHCCQCEDCARFEREPGWCVRCGEHDPTIGWNDCCPDCEREMGL